MRACCRRLETIDWSETRKFTPGFYAEVAGNLLSKYAYTVNKYYDPRMRDLMAGLLARERFDVLICDFLQPARNVLDLPFAPKILFQHNVESVIRERQYKAARNALMRALLYWDWRRLFAFEREAARRFNHCIMVSEQDCETMRTLYGATNTSAIPTGVDVEFFRPQAGNGAGQDIAFTGSMDWLPNEDAMHFFAADILPLIRSQAPSTAFWAVGRDPSPAVRALGARDPAIRVTGTVDDIRPFVARAGVYVVPLRIGGGTRIKIFEAMAMGKAIVSTRIGAEGLPVTHGENIVLADEPAEFAREVLALLRDPDRRERLGRAARSLVVERYTWDAAARCFSDICERQRVSAAGGATCG
jgi:glycosyltransferase involved in cell wall biosynthesis